MNQDVVSLAEARRIALAAQGFDRPRPRGRVGLAHLRGTIQRLALLQIDFVKVLAPSHYLVPFSRLGPYNSALLDELVYRRREFTEQWAHEASIIPVASWPLLRHRMEVHRPRPYHFEPQLKQLSKYVEQVLKEIADRGPLTADVLPHPDGVARRIEGAWFGSVPRAVLEACFGRGILAVAARRDDLARFYDLAERVVPREHHGRVIGRQEAQRELVHQAAKALGIATASDLADYFRMSPKDVRPLIADLVSAGELVAVRVEGWREPAYLHADATIPKQIEARALLSPFDPVIWYRPRAARLFQFDFRFEIFVPPEKRRWGAYVLPFLSGDRLVARVDLKSDRPGRCLQVLAAYGEPGIQTKEICAALALELRTLAGWLGLDSVAVGRRGDLARPLAAALRK